MWTGKWVNNEINSIVIYSFNFFKTEKNKKKFLIFLKNIVKNFLVIIVVS